MAAPVLNARSPAVRLTEGRHDPGEGLPWHEHDCPSFCYVLEGRFEELIPGEILACHPRTLKYTPAGLRHANRFPAGPARGLMLEVEGEFLERLSGRARRLTGPRQYDRGLACLLAGALTRELLADPQLPPVALEGLVAEVIAAALAAPPSPRERPGARWLLEVESIVQEELPTVGGLRQLADRVAVHPVTLARGFRRRFGCSLGEYIRRSRLECAVHLLARDERPLAAVAVAAGFADQSHMTRVLRRATGWTPARLRCFLAGREAN